MKPEQRPTKTGGQVAISGFLFQLLRSVKLGLRVSGSVTFDSEETATMLLTLEPEDGGDLRLDHAGGSIIEQVKRRAPHLKWSPAIVADTVFRDLLKSSAPGTNQSFRFVTDNADGLDDLRAFLAGHRTEAEGHFHWNRREKLSRAAFEERLAGSAGAAADRVRFKHLLDHFTIEIDTSSNAERGIDAMIAPLLDAGHKAVDKRHELIGRFLELASGGAAVCARELLSLVSEDAERRLGLANWLATDLQTRVADECRLLRYDPAVDSRLKPVEITAPLVLFTGESGQGKTWRLCAAAVSLASSGRLSIVISAPATVNDLVQAINERLWLGAFEVGVAIPVMARRLCGMFKREDGFWLTVFVDDVQDRKLANDLADLTWARHGIRLVISAQPRVTNAICKRANATTVESVGNFTSAELRCYLRHHGRHHQLLDMPDDVFELLLKPIHARVFVELPANTGWRGATEYRLFKEYWRFATQQSREQSDYPQDNDGLIQLVDRLSEEQRYPFATRDFGRASLSNEAILRLEKVGLLYRHDDGSIGFSSDRILSWGVAESFARQVEDDAWTPEGLDQRLAALDDLQETQNAFARRLGYVFLDTLWLVAAAKDPAWVSRFLLAHGRRRQSAWRDQEFWSLGIGTLGAVILPAIEALSSTCNDDGMGFYLSRYIPIAMAAIGEGELEETRRSIAHLLASEAENVVDVGLRCAAGVPTPSAIETIWQLHIERERAFEADRANSQLSSGFSTALLKVQISQRAARVAIAADPEWLERRLAVETDPYSLEHLLWALVDDECIDDDRAASVWRQCKEHVLSRLSGYCTVVIEAVGRFQDRDNLLLLDAVPDEETVTATARKLSTEVRIDPEAALLRLRRRDDRYGWSSTSWWLPELAHHDNGRLGDAIRENALKGDHPLTDVVLFYGNHRELIDVPTLKWVLDEFGLALAEFNETCAAGTRLGRLHHSLAFLSALFLPWQLDLLAARRGTELERQLLQMAIAREGRHSRTADLDGQLCERLLAMIDGIGFHELVVAELDRADEFGQEDGLAIARWSEHGTVTNHLSRKVARPGRHRDTFRDVLLLEALACHGLDYVIADLLRSETRLYLNAARIRHTSRGTKEPMRAEIGALVATGKADDVDLAIKLIAFFQRDEAHGLCEPFVEAAIAAGQLSAEVIGVFDFINFFDSRLFPLVVPRLYNSPEEATSIAEYLVAHGDGETRKAVLFWLEGLDLGRWERRAGRIVSALLAAGDNREAVNAFLRKVHAAGSNRLTGGQLRHLAETGDVRAREELLRSAYRRPLFDQDRIAASIEYLGTVDADEGFFAAHRFFLRDEAPEAISLLLKIDSARAIPLLLERYGQARPSTRQAIARSLRLHAEKDTVRQSIDALARSASQHDRIAACELAGWMPSGWRFDWLSMSTYNDRPALREVILAALHRRRLDEAGISHLRRLQSASKPGQWALLAALFDNIDPEFLWSADDPANLRGFLQSAPYEFSVEAERLSQRASKRIRDEARRLDDKWEKF